MSPCQPNAADGALAAARCIAHHVAGLCAFAGGSRGAAVAHFHASALTARSATARARGVAAQIWFGGHRAKDPAGTADAGPSQAQIRALTQRAVGTGVACLADRAGDTQDWRTAILWCQLLTSLDLLRCDPRALRWVARARTIATAVGHPWASAVAALARCQATGPARRSAAMRAGRTAATAFEAEGDLLLAGVAHVELGHLCDRAADESGAAHHFDQSRDHLDAWAGQRPARRARLAELTARERDVALAIHGGLRNREIAAALVVSPRTVEAHVRSILAKLGVGNRAAVAALVGQERLDYRPLPK